MTNASVSWQYGSRCGEQHKPADTEAVLCRRVIFHSVKDLVSSLTARRGGAPAGTGSITFTVPGQTANVVRLVTLRHGRGSHLVPARTKAITSRTGMDFIKE